MPCKEQEQEEQEQWEKVQDADVEVENARRKLENRLKGAAAACVLGVIGGLGGLTGLLGGGAACIAALLVADDAAADLEKAQAEAAHAHERHSRANMAHFLCLIRCDLEAAQP